MRKIISLFRTECLVVKGSYIRRNSLLQSTALTNSCVRFNRFINHQPPQAVEHRLAVQLERKKTKMNPEKFKIESAILRYQPGAERFQFTFKLSSGKLFNFDRQVSETLEAFQERMVTNMKKKFRDAEIQVNFSLPQEYQRSDPLKPFLEYLVSSTPRVLFQINDGSGKVISVNPPEVQTLKFHEKAFVGFPVHPSKIEATPNFSEENSVFQWEAVRVQEPGNEMNSKTLKSKLQDPRTKWTPCGSGLILFPGEDLEGSHLRLVCTPSDGESYGETYIAEFPAAVRKIPVKRLLCEEITAGLSPIDSTDPQMLRVMSYNILADTYTTPEWFNNSPLEALDYSYRLALLEKELAAYSADIICLQEVDEKCFTWDLEPYLRKLKNLMGNFSCKFGNTREGVATFFNPQKLSIVGVETIKITEALASSQFWSLLEQNEKLKNRLEERNTVFQITVLESRNEDKSIIVLGVTHLYFHPTADHIRLLQTIVCAQQLEAKVQEMKEKYPGRKVRALFAGDFNCTPPYSSYRLLTTGEVREDDPDWISCEAEEVTPGICFSHNLNFEPTHKDEALTNITLNFEGCIDYIFFQPEHFELVKAYPPPDKALIAKISGCLDYLVSLPNFVTPSDHLPVIADIKLI